MGRWPPVRPRARGLQAVACPLGHQGVLELGDCAEDLEEHPPDSGRCVYALVQYDQVDLAGLEVLGQGDQVLQGATEPV